MKYRKQVEEWIIESITNEYDYDDPEYPGEMLDSVHEFEHKIMSVLKDLTNDELVDMFYQHSCGYTFEELEEDIEYEFMQEHITCVITRADRIRLSEVDKKKSLMENFKIVMDLYERSLMTVSHPEKTKDVLASEIIEILEAMAEHDKNIDDVLSDILGVFEQVANPRIKEPKVMNNDNM